MTAANQDRLREVLELAFYEAEKHVPSKEGYCEKCGFCHCETGHVLAMAKQGVLDALAAVPEVAPSNTYPYSTRWMKLRSYLKEILEPRQYDTAKELLEVALLVVPEVAGGAETVLVIEAHKLSDAAMRTLQCKLGCKWLTFSRCTMEKGHSCDCECHRVWATFDEMCRAAQRADAPLTMKDAGKWLEHPKCNCSCHSDMPIGSQECERNGCAICWRLFQQDWRADAPVPADRDEKLLALANRIFAKMGLGRAEHSDIQAIFDELDLAWPKDTAAPHLAECQCLSCIAGLSPKETFHRTQQSPDAPVPAPAKEIENG